MKISIILKIIGMSLFIISLFGGFAAITFFPDLPLLFWIKNLIILYPIEVAAVCIIGYLLFILGLYLE